MDAKNKFPSDGMVTRATVRHIESGWQRFLAQTGITDEQAILDSCRLSVRYLKQLALSLTTLCNYNCPFCFNHFEKHYGYYQAVTPPVDSLVNLVREHGPLHEVAFSVAGEPFLRAEVFDIMEGMRPFVGGFVFSTNAGLLTPEKIDRLADFPIHGMYVSAEGCDPVAYARYRENGDFVQFTRNVSYLAGKFADRLSVASVFFRENAADILKMPALCAALGIPSLSPMPLVSHRKTDSKGLTPMDGEEVAVFLLRLLENCDRHGVACDVNNMTCDYKTALYLQEKSAGVFRAQRTQYTDPCRIMDGLQIDPKGNVGFCCGMEFTPQDGFNRPLTKLFNSPELLKLRLMNIAGRFPDMCKTYCHKIDDIGDCCSTSINRKIQNFKIHRLPRRRVAAIKNGLRLAVWPYGTQARAFFERNDFPNQNIVGIFERNPSQQQIPELPPVQTLGALSMAEYDALLLCSDAFVDEILADYVLNRGGLGREVYFVDSRDRIFHILLQPEL